MNDTIEGHDFDSLRWYYSITLKINLQNKQFKSQNKDLYLIFEGILTESFSNAFAEFLEHIGNVTAPTHRKGMYQSFSNKINKCKLHNIYRIRYIIIGCIVSNHCECTIDLRFKVLPYPEAV